MALGARYAGALDLLAHVDLVEVLHRAVVQALELGHRLVGHLPAERAHVHREPLREARVLRQPVEALYVHAAAPPAVDAPPLELHPDPPAGHREVASAAGPLVVPAPAPATTLPATRSFFRRRRRMARAYRSPKTPPSCACATKPDSEKSARIDLGAFTGAACPRSCTTSRHQPNAGNQLQTLASCITPPSADPLDPAKTPLILPCPYADLSNLLPR